MLAIIDLALEDTLMEIAGNEVGLAEAIRKRAELRDAKGSLDLDFVMQADQVGRYLKSLHQVGEVLAYSAFSHNRELATTADNH